MVSLTVLRRLGIGFGASILFVVVVVVVVVGGMSMTAFTGHSVTIKGVLSSAFSRPGSTRTLILSLACALSPPLAPDSLL